MTKSCALLLSVTLLAAPAGHAKDVIVRADWQKARAMLTQGEYSSRIAVELKLPKRVTLIPDRGKLHPRNRKEVELKPSKWLKGKFIEATEAGLQVLFRGHEISYTREEIRRIRLVHRAKNRRIGLLIGIPVGIGVGLGSGKAYCSAGDRCGGVAGLMFLVGIPMAVAYVFHKLDRRSQGDRGDVIVVLDEITANKPPVPSQIR